MIEHSKQIKALSPKIYVYLIYSWSFIALNMNTCSMTDSCDFAIQEIKLLTTIIARQWHLTDVQHLK